MSVISATLSAWKAVSFEQLKQELDTQAGEIASQQDESDASRKRLVEQSREFKASTPAEVRKSVAPLLKSFQTEVDALSKRAKQSETAFLSLYKRLIDLPDPAAAFQHVAGLQRRAQRCSDLEIENKQLRERLAEYNAEFAEVRNQEVTVKQLRERVKELEESADARVAAAVRDKERQLSMSYGEKEKQLSQQQLEAAQRLAEAEQRANQLQSARDSAQADLLAARQQLEDRQLARSDEMEMLAQDVERATERAAWLEKELQRAREQLQLGRGQRGDSPSPLGSAEEATRRAELEAQLAAKDREVSQLVSDLRRQQKVAEELRSSKLSATSQLEEQLAEKVRALAVAEERLRHVADYSELRRELGVLRAIQFPADSGDGEGEGDGDGDGDGQSLEQRLLRQNRWLQSECAGLRARADRLQAEADSLRQRADEAADDSRQQRRLVQQLEEDLAKMKAFTAVFRGAAEGQEAGVGNESSGPSAEAEALATVLSSPSDWREQQQEQQLKQQLEQQLEQQQQQQHPQQQSKPEASLLSIVQSQRERFRARAQELEVANVSLQQQLGLSRTELDRVRSDNVKLYEKIRFLQSYNPSSSSSASASQEFANYSDAYESRLDPFSSFGRSERQRKYSQLRAHDKLTLSIGRLVMSDARARAVAFCYTLLLHLLVFAVLYKMAYMESSRRDLSAECERRFAEHMLKAHKH